MSRVASAFDAAIVGFGPVGAFAALTLAREGLRVAILELSTEPVVLPRAVGMDGESVRAFQRLGLHEEVDAILQPPREKDEYCFTNSRREPLFGLEMPPFGHNGWRDNAFFDQPELEALLRELVARDERIEVRLGHEVVGLDQSGDEVVLRTRSRDGEATVRADYAIGCDGASSFVRRELGIDWVSLGYDQDWLVIDITIGPEAQLPTTTMQVCDPARLTTYVPVKDPNRRWEFALLEGETREKLLESAKIESLLAPWLPAEHYTIRRKAVYQFHAATAERMQQGRVFLAGDAAHQTPPFLGQGLNSGLRDAANLGWRLPLIQAGLCDARLFEGYDVERSRHARDLVDRAVGIGQLMETLAAREAGLPDPHAAAAERAATPEGSTGISPPLVVGTLIGEQLGDSSAVGRLLRQPTVRRPGKAPQRFDELLGRGFALVGAKPADLRLGPEANAALERLGASRVSLDDLECVEGELDQLFAAHPAAIVRPDRHVYGVVDDELDLDALVARLARDVALC
jgi:3-(3-hydroxy-phenyl)propionate hydroxylase